jgi:hypothetical protein
MGKLVDVLKGVPLSPARQQQVSALDRELSNLEARDHTLDDENHMLHDAACAAGRGDDGDDTLSVLTAEMLASMTEAAIPKDELFRRMGLTPANGNRHLDILIGRHFIAAGDEPAAAGVYRATAEGCTYLARNHSA